MQLNNPLERRVVDVSGALALVVLFVCCVLFGVRSDYVGVDTIRYIEMYYSFVNGIALDRDVEPGILLLASIFSVFNSHQIFFLSISLIIFVQLSNLQGFGATWRFAILLYCMMLSPFFYGMNLNVLRQGLAFAIVFGFLIVGKNSLSRNLFFGAVAGAFHFTGFVFAILLIVVEYLKLRSLVLIWLLCLVMGYFDVLQNLMGSLLTLGSGFEYYASYTDGSDTFYLDGFRVDFILFSVFGVACFALLRYFGEKSKFDGRDLDWIEWIIKVCILFNCLAVAMVRVPYSDRWFNWTWSIFPLIIYFAFIMYAPQRSRQISAIALVLPALGSLYLNYSYIASIQI